MILRFRDADGDTRLVNVDTARSVLVRLPHEDDGADELREYVHVQWHTHMGGEITSIFTLAPGEGARLVGEIAGGTTTSWRGN